MRHIRFLSALLAGTLGLAACADETPTAVQAPTAAARSIAGITAPAAPARHLVVFKSKAPPAFESRVAALGGTVVMNHEIGVAVVTGLSESAAASLRTQVGAQYVEAEPEFQLVEPAGITAPQAVDALATAPAEPASAGNPAGAILFSRQWNMRQIHADQAWAAGHLGDPGVTVAILDTGIDYLLPDLVGRVDLARSTSFEPLDDAYAAYYFPGRDPSTDLHFHGTNVATQVASNAWAFAGVTSRTTLMSVKVCSFAGGCHGVFEGILWAVDHGADVINMSLGGGFAKSDYPGAVSAYNRLMNYANQKGVTIVVAAGNDGIDLDRNRVPDVDADGNPVTVHVPGFFASYCDATHVICVAATRQNDVPASYTNYGRSAVDVAAPGGDAGEWVYALCPQTSLLYNCAGGYFTLGVAGTSQATPHVSGLAALAVQEVGRSPSRVRAYVRNSADAIGGGNTAFYGKGRINVAHAVGLN